LFCSGRLLQFKLITHNDNHNDIDNHNLNHNDLDNGNHNHNDICSEFMIIILINYYSILMNIVIIINILIDHSNLNSATVCHVE